MSIGGSFGFTTQPAGDGGNAIVSVVSMPCSGIYVCGQDIPGNSIVKIIGGKAYIADPLDNLSGGDVIRGMAVGSMISGGQLMVVWGGSVSGATNLISDAIYYLGPNGVPTITPPTKGWYLVIGTALDSATYNIKLGNPIYRN